MTLRRDDNPTSDTSCFPDAKEQLSLTDGGFTGLVELYGMTVHQVCVCSLLVLKLTSSP